MKRTLKDILKEKAEKKAQKLAIKKLEKKVRDDFMNSCNLYMLINNCTFQEAYEHLIKIIN